MSLFTKQPSEEYPIAVEWAGKLPSGATLSTVAVTAIDTSSGSDATSTVLGSSAISGTQTRVLVKAGTDGKQYRITFKVVLSDGSKLEEDLVMSVVER